MSSPPPKSFYANLPAKRMAAGALILDTAQNILLVQPNYKPNWEIPGGMIEQGESPFKACQREIKEELGLSLSLKGLLCIDYTSETEARTDSLQFIFDGGILSQSQQLSVHLQTAELLSFGFYSLVEAKDKLNIALYQRVVQALNAKKYQSVRYLENQKPLF